MRAKRVFVKGAKILVYATLVAIPFGLVTVLGLRQAGKRLRGAYSKRRTARPLRIRERRLRIARLNERVRSLTIRS